MTRAPSPAPGYGAFELLELGLPYLGPALVSPTATARLRAFADELPPVVFFGAYECRLGSHDSRVDYALGVPALPQVRRLLAGDVRDEQAASGGDERWRRIRSSMSVWARASALSLSRFLWIEVDAPTPDTDRDEFFPFLVYSLRESSDEDPQRRAQDTRALVGAVLALDEDDEMLDGVAELARRLPDWCAVRHVALRDSVTGRALRAVCRMPVTQAAKFAAGGDSRAGARAIRQLVEAVHEHPVVTNVNFDLTPDIGKRVGVEFHLTCATHEDRRWLRLLDALSALELLCAEKRAALETWPSPRDERDVGRMPAGRVVRDLVVKVDFDDRQAMQAKAYLTFAPDWALRQQTLPGRQAAA